MCTTAVSFKWLDILEKEFDSAFVTIDLLLGDIDLDERLVVNTIRKKLGTICSCFSQLSHKALTIFQINAKTEAELVHLKTEIVEIKTRNEILEKEIHSFIVQLQASQLQKLNFSNLEETKKIRTKLHRELNQHSPTHSSNHGMEKTFISLENWKRRLQAENEILRRTIVALQAEVCGSRLAAKYLDKELAGRMQQLQLLRRNDMNNDVRAKLWDQLDAEILLQRHKTVIKVMRQQKSHVLPPDNVTDHVRNVYLSRESSKGLGISVTGGKEHGVPIIVSELEPWCSNKNLYIGDAILAVNGIDLNQLMHKEAVKVLSEQMGNVILTVLTLSAINVAEMEEETNSPSYISYPFFEEIQNINNYSEDSSVSNTPTAPRTPPSRNSIGAIPADDIVDDIRKSEDHSELYGVTTLQKIFRTVSSIESNREKIENGNHANSNNKHVMIEKEDRLYTVEKHADKEHKIPKVDDSTDKQEQKNERVEKPSDEKPQEIRQVLEKEVCKEEVEKQPSKETKFIETKAGKKVSSEKPICNGNVHTIVEENAKNSEIALKKGKPKEGNAKYTELVPRHTKLMTTTFNISLATEQSDNPLSVVSGIGDSTVGTPV